MGDDLNCLHCSSALKNGKCPLECDEPRHYRITSVVLLEAKNAHEARKYIKSLLKPTTKIETVIPQGIDPEHYASALNE